VSSNIPARDDAAQSTSLCAIWFGGASESMVIMDTYHTALTQAIATTIATKMSRFELRKWRFLESRQQSRQCVAIRTTKTALFSNRDNNRDKVSRFEAKKRHFSRIATLITTFCRDSTLKKAII
jgi:hypothetical protein